MLGYAEPTLLPPIDEQPRREYEQQSSRGTESLERWLPARAVFQLEGETTVFEDIGASGMRVARRCCARCGSPLTTEPDVVADLMMVKVGGIDDNQWFRPEMELFVARRRPWLQPVPGAQQFDGNPPV